MGFKSDQNLFSNTCRPSSDADGRHPPPPLPPRVDHSSQTIYSDPPPYTESGPVFYSQPLTNTWSGQDPRSSSTQSLVPENSNDGKRRLLLVYIHGFMGNETSFQGFPAHVHNLVTVKLAETHQVHTKIYPKYKSRKAIEYARDDFSKWLRPHESPGTDVILIGHSMGGLLSAEVALLGQSSNGSETFFQHHILGTINLDTPFLGIHPGVIGSGIGSLFRPAPDTPASAVTTSQENDLNQAAKLASTSNDSMPVMQDPAPSSENRDCTNGQSISLPTESDTTERHPVSPFLSPANDPNYNQPFPNDARKASRKGWENALHFVNKHSDSLMRATRSYVMSYFEFGGCLADYNGLKDRYSRLRILEESEYRRRNGQRRVRFVNYYTASTGRPKRQKSRPTSPAGAGARFDEHSDTDVEPQAPEQRLHDVSLSTPGTRSRSTSPRIPLTELTDDELIPETPVETEDTCRAQTPKVISGSNAASERENPVGPPPIPDETDNEVLGDDALGTTSNQDPGNLQPSTSASIHSNSDSLPPIPPQPQAPPAFDPTPYPERDVRNLAAKNHARQLKAYQRAIKDRDNAIKDRRKLLEKREKAARQSREKQLKREEKEKPPKPKKEKEKAKNNTKQEPKPTTHHSHQSESAVAEEEEKEEKKTPNKKPERKKKARQEILHAPTTTTANHQRWGNHRSLLGTRVYARRRRGRGPLRLVSCSGRAV